LSHFCNYIQNSSQLIFCLIEGKKVFISNKAFTDIARSKEFDYKKLENYSYKEKILFCEKNYMLDDLFDYKDGILFLGDISELHS
jgi:hypothetical protein